jgi:hypothetical protein
MTIKAIREVMHRGRPFKIKAADGSVYAVKHPDFISVGGTDDDGIVVVHTAAGLAILSLENITAIELPRRSPAA